MTIRFLGLLILVAGCGPGDTVRPPAPVEPVDTGSLSGIRVFFGHHSVGRDILAGVATIAPELRIAPFDGAPPDGGVLIEGPVGHNEHPDTKDRAFLEALPGLGAIDLALYKYCYVDVGPGTDPGELYRRYVRTLDEARVPTIPVTLPLTTVEPGWKRWLKELSGRTTQAALNLKRMQFNEMIRERYGAEGIVDLARMESTREDGTRSLVDVDGAAVECLAPEFTDDGAHLNRRGREHVARGFLQALAHAAARR